MLRRLPVALVAFTVAVLGFAGAARAYPQWQLSTGAARCNQCHYAPAGGGLLTSYGRDAAGEELASFGGDGAFLHGAVALPGWLALGGDLRGAFVVNDVQDPRGPAVAAFPMQADASGRLAVPVAGLSFTGTVGLRGQVRDPDILVPVQNYQPVDTSQVISREHYLMLQPEALGPYLRVGRFFAPFGLRFAEHTLYVRRDLGFDQLQETYNFSAGVVQPSWELHLSLFAPDFIRHIGSDENGFAAYFERRVANDRTALAGQTRLAVSPGVTRLIVGAVAKTYVERLSTLFMAEVDGVHLTFDDPALSARGQIVGVAGLTLFPARGVMLTLLGERNQADLAFADAWTAGNLFINWFPYAHCELQAVGRLQFPSGGNAISTLLVQLHYFL